MPQSTVLVPPPYILIHNVSETESVFEGEDLYSNTRMLCNIAIPEPLRYRTDSFA